MKTRKTKRNPVVRALRSPTYRKRIEKKRAGRGSYSRKGRRTPFEEVPVKNGYCA